MTQLIAPERLVSLQKRLAAIEIELAVEELESESLAKLATADDFPFARFSESRDRCAKLCATIDEYIIDMESLIDEWACE